MFEDQGRESPASKAVGDSSQLAALALFCTCGGDVRLGRPQRQTASQGLLGDQSIQQTPSVAHGTLAPLHEQKAQVGNKAKGNKRVSASSSSRLRGAAVAARCCAGFCSGARCARGRSRRRGSAAGRRQGFAKMLAPPLGCQPAPGAPCSNQPTSHRLRSRRCYWSAGGA